MSAFYDIVCLVSNDITYDRRMIRICSALADAGKKVLLIGRELPDSKALDSYSFDVDRISCKYNRGPLFYAELIRRLKKYLKGVSFSNLVVTDLDTALVARSYKNTDVKVYCDLHEYFEETPELIGKYIKKWIWSQVGQQSNSSIDVMYTVNQSLADIFSVQYNRKVVVIRNLPDPMDQRSCDISIPLKTVYLGVLNPGRGLESIIRAVANVKEVELTIIGDGPLRLSLELLAKDYRDRIKFTGALQPSAISKELSKHHLGWNVLDNKSKSYYYSLANKFYDYINHGLPVITMDYPEYKKIVNHYNCGILLSDDHVETIADQLVRLKDNTAKIIAMQSNCASVILEHNWSIESKKLLSLF